MNQKRFTFEDEDEKITARKETLSQIDYYEDYQADTTSEHVQESLKNAPKQTQKVQEIHERIVQDKEPKTDRKVSQVKPDKTRDKSSQRVQQKRPKTKVKKKTKRKNKTKTKVIKEKRKRSWFSTLILFLLSLIIIAGVAVGGYIAYEYYLKQQNQINQLQNQLDNQQPQQTAPGTSEGQTQEPKPEEPPTENQPETNNQPDQNQDLPQNNEEN